jgi:hypothetical protein
MTGLRSGVAIRAFLVALALAVGTWTEALAQDGPSVLSLLAPRGEVSVDDVRADVLDSDDYLVRSGRRVTAYALSAEQGDAFVINLRSDDFDAYLYVVGPAMGSGITDDDGGEGFDSRLCFAAPTSGSFRIVVGALTGGTGEYSLDVGAAAVAEDGTCQAGGGEIEGLESLPAHGRTIPLEGAVQGQFTDDDATYFGEPVQAWTIDGSQGQEVSIDLTSSDFDAHLTVFGPGMDEWLMNDDGAGACNARVSFAFPEDGTYTVVASDIGIGTGVRDFAMATSAQPGPVDEAPCGVFTDPLEEGFDVYELAEVPVVGQLEPEVAAAGQLDATAIRFGGAPAIGWTMTASRGQRLAIDLVSRDFDAYMYFGGPGFPNDLFDDDGGDVGLDSRLCVDIPEDGEYRVVASSISSTAEGGYSMFVSENPGTELCPSFQFGPARYADALFALPTVGRRLEMGATSEGVLTDSVFDPVDGVVVQPWSLAGTADESVSVELRSAAFDVFLRIVGPGMEELGDDDSAGGCDARIDFQFPETGEYRVLVGSAYPGEQGPYEVSVASEAGPVSSDPCGGFGTTLPVEDFTGVLTDASREIEIGYQVDGQLTADDSALPDGELAQAWTFRAEEGDQLILAVDSEDFDAVIYVHGPGMSGVRTDDDSGTNSNARLQFVAPQSGTYRVMAGSFFGGAGGAYRLWVVRSR